MCLRLWCFFASLGLGIRRLLEMEMVVVVGELARANFLLQLANTG